MAFDFALGAKFMITKFVKANNLHVHAMFAIQFDNLLKLNTLF